MTQMKFQTEGGRLFLGEASKKYAGVDAEETSMAAILIPEFVSFSFL